MNTKKYILIAGVTLVAGFLIYRQFIRDGGVAQEDYIIQKGTVSLKDIRTSLKKIDFNEQSIKEYFGGNIVNPYTIEFFNSLQSRFGEFTSLENHFEQVREYLLSVMSPGEADRLMNLYRSYVQYQKNLMAEMPTWGMPGSTESTIQYLKKIQEYRRNYFGKETADILFGAEMLVKEYSIRRMSIVNDDNLYGQQKEEKLKKLTGDMWGDEAEELESKMSPFDKYQEKLHLYSKDLKDLSSQDQQEMIVGFRKDLFPPEVVERFESMDKLLAAEEKKEQSYRAEEDRILKNPNLKADEKDRKIKELQDSIFGDAAEDFRNRELFQKNVIGQ